MTKVVVQVCAGDLLSDWRGLDQEASMSAFRGELETSLNRWLDLDDARVFVHEWDSRVQVFGTERVAEITDQVESMARLVAAESKWYIEEV